MVLQLAEPQRKCLRADPLQRFQQITEPHSAFNQQVADNQKGPLGPDNIECFGNGAGLAGYAFGQNDRLRSVHIHSASSGKR
ncbi:hypothetical protein D3C71_1956340 [compost metagenome]